MPARVSNATGNWSDTTNWLTASHTASVGTGNTVLNQVAKYSATFTAPNTTAKCVGVMLYIAARTGSSNITVTLQANSVDVATMTANAADVPLNQVGWYFFRFATPYQYTTTTAGFYRFGVTISTGTLTTLLTDTGGTLMTAIAIDDRTSAVAATDDAFVMSDVGGSAKIITFDKNDLTTTCLSLNICYNATVTFNTTMTTQMIVGNATTSALGTIYSGGTLAVGTVSNPIPSTYTATLGFDGNNTAGNNTFILHSGASGTQPGYFSAVGTPGYNSRAKTVEGYSTGWYATTTSVNAAAGSTTLVLTEDLGLRAGGGDVIGISECDGSAGYNNQNEVRTTASYNAATKTITLTTGLTSLKNVGAIVHTHTRNVVIKAINTGRTVQINSTGNNTVPCPGAAFRHAQFDYVNRIGNANASFYTPFSGLDFVGLSLTLPIGVANTGFTSLYGGRLINCHFYRALGLTTSSPASTTDVGVTKTLEVIGCSHIAQGLCYNGVTGATIRDSLISGTYWLQSCANCRVINCTGADSQGFFYISNECEFINCTATNTSFFFRESQNCVMDSCRILGNYNYIHEQGNGGWGGGNNLMINCSANAAPALGRLNAITTQPTLGSGGRFVRIQSCTLPSVPNTLSVHWGGYVRRYDSVSAPQPVFPTPSGAQVANRIEQLNAPIDQSPVIVTYRIQVPSGTQSNRVSIPVYLSGWGTSLPSATELFLEMFVPGLNAPITSTSTVTVNDQWQYLTVMGTSSVQGYLTVNVRLKKYVANAVCYVDWPVGMDTSAMEWYDGRPNEYMIPAKTLASLDAEANLVAAPFTSPPKYSYGQDKKSLRIDGPGVREFTIRVTPKLNVLRIQARYDQYHGTTNKPQVIIKAEPELGLAQQTRTLSVGADQWETEEFAFVPNAEGVIVLQLVSRSATPWGGAWFDNFSIE